MPAGRQVFFLEANAPHAGHRFCVYHPNQTDLPCQGLVVYLHPFAEEMNKSRRMAALQAQALAQNGYSVLQIDLLGCGDSSGDFADATWEGWIADVVLACNCLRVQNDAEAKTPASAIPFWLWGLRAGCLLAVAAEPRLDFRCNFLFWQPPASGKLLLQQFLRLKVAADMMSGQSKGVMEGLKQQLKAGASVEIAGYELSARLALGLEGATLVLEPKPKGPSIDAALRIECFETTPKEDAELSPPTSRMADAWAQMGRRARVHKVTGPAFWQTTEIEDAPALVHATAACLRDPTADSP
jgi:uncharacterized protein